MPETTATAEPFIPGPYEFVWSTHLERYRFCTRCGGAFTERVEPAGYMATTGRPAIRRVFDCPSGRHPGLFTEPTEIAPAATESEERLMDGNR